LNLKRRDFAKLQGHFEKGNAVGLWPFILHNNDQGRQAITDGTYKVHYPHLGNYLFKT